MFSVSPERKFFLLHRFKNLPQTFLSSFPGIVLRKGLIPENHRSFTQVVIIPDRLALWCYSLLRAVLERLFFLIAFGIQNALQEHLLILVAARLVVELGRAKCFVNRLKNSVDEAKESFVRHLALLHDSID